MGGLAGAVLSDVVPVPAASVLLVRDDPFEVLMLRRHSDSRVAPDAWVFPGGAVEAGDEELARRFGDGSTLDTMRITAAREAFEEAGVWLGAPLADAPAKRDALLRRELTISDLLAEGPMDLASLVWTSRWITPAGMPWRFDTWFFVTAVDRGVVASAEQQEAVEVAWISPAEALRRKREMKMLFPTLKNLEAVAAFATAAELVASRRGAVIEPVQPILVDGKPTLP